jgi:hypothetical protein
VRVDPRHLGRDVGAKAHLPARLGVDHFEGTQVQVLAGAVTSNIAGVARASEETGAAAAQVLSSASELSRQSEHLSAEVARFLGTVRAA